MMIIILLEVLWDTGVVKVIIIKEGVHLSGSLL